MRPISGTWRDELSARHEHLLGAHETTIGTGPPVHPIQHMGRLAIPSLVLAEPQAGAYMRVDPAPLLSRIDDLLVFLQVLDFDAACAEEFGRLRGLLHRHGLTVPPIDLLIASVAMAYDLTLVTNNTAYFAPIPGLRLEDWLTP